MESLLLLFIAGSFPSIRPRATLDLRYVPSKFTNTVLCSPSEALAQDVCSIQAMLLDPIPSLLRLTSVSLSNTRICRKSHSDSNSSWKLEQQTQKKAICKTKSTLKPQFFTLGQDTKWLFHCEGDGTFNSF